MPIKDFLILLAAVLLTGFLSGLFAMCVFHFINLPDCNYVPGDLEKDCKYECTDFSGDSLIYYECLSFCLAYDWDKGKDVEEPKSTLEQAAREAF